LAFVGFEEELVGGGAERECEGAEGVDGGSDPASIDAPRPFSRAERRRQERQQRRRP
jgi:hypothetical protein